MEQERIGAVELAEMLELSVRTIYNRVSAAPETLPPQLFHPNRRRLLWDKEVVRAWMQQQDSGVIRAALYSSKGRWQPVVVRGGEQLRGNPSDCPADAWAWVFSQLSLGAVETAGS